MAGVSTATGIVANVGSNVISEVWKEIFQVVKMVRALPTDVGNMNEEVQRLKNLRDEINTELAREQRNAKTIVQNWLTKAGEAIDNSVSINTQYDQQKNCLGCWPNYLCRYRISKAITAWKLTVNQLHSERQADFPANGELGDPAPRTHISIQHPEVAGNGIQAAQLELERWLTHKDSNIQRIGIHGMAGVGKTLLLDIINNSQTVRNSFQLILKVTVSRNHILDLQDCIARRLNLRAFPDKSNSEERAEMLRSSLEAKQNYLVLLDDIWGDSALWTIDDLQNLGVSLNNNRGNKIVLTTRDKDVCARMNVQEIRTVPLLSEEDGWQLFRSRAFQNRNGDVPEDIEEFARQIAKECKGLPLAITVVAAAMTKHTDLHDWEVALGQLRNLPAMFYDLHPGVDERLFQRLKWSYDALTLPDLKTCFLYFAAYPEDAIISCTQVIDMWIADSLVKGNEDSYLHDTGRTYINQLRDRCLIEVAEKDARGRISSVRMHDVLRDLAILIAEKEHSCYFKAGQGVTRFPVAEVADPMGCARLSLMYNRLDSDSLPTTFACSSLSVLLLGQNPGIKEISGSFLSELPSLKVLNLSFTGITSLPSSIGDLKHLAFLQLRGTQIRKLPETVGDLNNLQFLGVENCSQLRCLPERISELKRLRALDIGVCRRLSQLPRGIAELVSLERLNMGFGVPLDFDDGNAERKHACLKDMQSLGCLRELSVVMKSPVQEGVIGNWSKMRVLSLQFTRGVNQDYLPQDMQAMKDLEILELEQCNVKRLPSWVSEFRRLECLTLTVCQQLEELELGMGFRKLQQLRLWGLNSLQCMRAVAAASGSGRLGDGASSLPMLKSLSVGDCTELRTLCGEWDKLKCLEEIKGKKSWWDALQWEDPSMKASLESKFRRWP